VVTIRFHDAVDWQAVALMSRVVGPPDRHGVGKGIVVLVRNTAVLLPGSSHRGVVPTSPPSSLSPAVLVH
jgi:hypothetical protein